jgi:hypothetical protein
MAAVGSSETLVNTDQTTRRHIPEDNSLKITLCSVYTKTGLSILKDDCSKVAECISVRHLAIYCVNIVNLWWMYCTWAMRQSSRGQLMLFLRKLSKRWRSHLGKNVTPIYFPRAVNSTSVFRLPSTELQRINQPNKCHSPNILLLRSSFIWPKLSTERVSGIDCSFFQSSVKSTGVKISKLNQSTGPQKNIWFITSLHSHVWHPVACILRYNLNVEC